VAPINARTCLATCQAGWQLGVLLPRRSKVVAVAVKIVTVSTVPVTVTLITVGTVAVLVTVVAYRRLRATSPPTNKSLSNFQLGTGAALGPAVTVKQQVHPSSAATCTHA
jgi:hypothetical protein